MAEKDMVREEFALKSSDLIELAGELWRFKRFMNRDEMEMALPARHFFRRMQIFLDKFSIEIVDLTGQNYEPGLAVEVLDVVENEAPENAPGTMAETILEMISPVILQNGKVIAHGKVIITR